MKHIIIAAITLGCLALPTQADDATKAADAKAKLEQAREKYQKGEEAEAIDICREAARLGSSEAQAQMAKWLVVRSLPKKKPSDAAKALREAERSEKTVVNILEQEIAALMKQCQQCQSKGEMSQEQLELMMQLMAMAGMKPGNKPGNKPGQTPGQTPGMNNSGGTTDKPNVEVPGSVNGDNHLARKIQKLSGRTGKLPKEFEGQLKSFFNASQTLRKKN